jgi:thiamine kinase-like enzyme
MQYIPLPGEPDPAWLSAVLRQAGILSSGEVTAIQIIPTGAFNSITNRLRVRYSPDSTPSAPQQLVLKQNTSQDWSIAAGIDEVSFYQLVREPGDHPPVVPPCYAAAYDPSTGRSYLLLQDLSETHAPPITRDEQISIIKGVPLADYQEAVIDTLAQLHAYWWNHPLQKTGSFAIGYWSLNQERCAQYLVKRRASWEGLLGRLEAEESMWFPRELRKFYEQIFAGLPHYWETYLVPRFQTRKNLTLIHGDTYFCNFLCPKLPATGPTYLLDWQSPSFDIGAYDLVNLLASFWTRTQRQTENREINLLHGYHTSLQNHGVRGYSWDDLVADYQAGLIFWILMPVQDGFDGAGKDYWWPKMQCLLQAFADWNCAEILQASFPFFEGGSICP